MITVTPEARDLFESVVRPEDAVLRLDVVDHEGDGGRPRVNLVAGEPRDDDQIVTQHSKDVLRIAREVSEALDGCVLKRIEMPEGIGFTIAPAEAEDDARA